MRLHAISSLFLFCCMLLFSCHEKKENTNKQITLEDLSEWNEKQYSLSSRKIRRTLDSLRLLTSGMYADKYTRAYYAARSPFLWIDRFGINERADTLVNRLEQTANATGLPSSCFRTEELKEHLRQIRNLDFSSGTDINTAYAHAEYLLTKAYIRYVCGQRFGYIDPDLAFNSLEKTDTAQKAPFQVLYDIKTEKADKAFVQNALAAQQSGDFETFFHEIAPKGRLYQQLVEKYAHTQGTGPKRKVAVNIERSRWRTENPENKHVLVNLAGMNLQAIDTKHEDTLHMKVCIGSRKNKSPMLTSQIERVEMNPYWNIPYSIVKNEIAPRHAGDVAYFTRNRYRIINKSSDEETDPATVTASMLLSGQYRVRQDNGEGNSLGRLIFRFPNRFSIFLHDTDNKRAFTRENRAISHGCIRVEKPLELAVFLLDEPDEDIINKIRTAIGLPPLEGTDEKATDETPGENTPLRTTTQRFKPPVPIFIQYYTLFPAANGEWGDYPDPYGYDDLLLEKMDAF